MIQFPDYVQRMCQEDEDNNCMLAYEFKVGVHHHNSKKCSSFVSMQDLQSVPTFTYNVARLSHNTKHNRFKNVYPCEDDRSLTDHKNNLLVA